MLALGGGEPPVFPVVMARVTGPCSRLTELTVAFAQMSQGLPLADGCPLWQPLASCGF